MKERKFKKKYYFHFKAFIVLEEKKKPAKL